MDKITRFPQPSDASSPQQNLKNVQKTQNPITQKIKKEDIKGYLPSGSSEANKTHKEAVVIQGGQQGETLQGEAIAVQKVQEAVTMHLPQEVLSSQTSAVTDQVKYVPVNRSRLQKSSFATITRNISSCQEMLIRHGRENEVRQLCSDIQQGGNWEHIIDRYRQTDPANLAMDALKGLRYGELSVEQFCTATYVYALLTEFPGAEIAIQPLFDERGNVDPAARKCVEEGIYNPNQHKNFFHQNEASGMTERFFEEMKYKSPSEQCFFYIALPGSQQRTMRDALKESVGFNVFTTCSFEGGLFSSIPSLFRMAPSFSMMQAVVDAYGQENTVAFCPTIGASTRSDFRRNADYGGREIFTPFPRFPCPSTADGIAITNSLEFLSHDLFHGLTCSQIPGYLRKETRKVADSIATLQKQVTPDEDAMTGPLLDTFYGRMVDMEFSLFRCKENIGTATKEEFFLMTLELQLFRNTKERMWLKLKTLPPLEQRAAIAALEKWGQIEEEINNQENIDSFFTVDFVSDGSVQEEEREKIFSDLFNDFCETSNVTRRMAESIYKSGCLTRLNISEENLINAKKYFKITGADRYREILGFNASLIDELLSLYKEGKKEEKR